MYENFSLEYTLDRTPKTLDYIITSACLMFFVKEYILTYIMKLYECENASMK